MRFSDIFISTLRDAPKGSDCQSAELLARGSFVDQLGAGIYSYLPLGLRVIHKISDIVREEMNKLPHTSELQLSVLQPKSLWQKSGRWEGLKGAMYQLKDSSDKELGLGFTHEEPIYDMVRRNVNSYRDLPIAMYQIQTKFRDEPRPRGGILRGVEFLMKDLYSFHLDVKDLEKYYWKVADAYMKVYKRLGLKNVYIVEASGGVFTKRVSHEFQVAAEAGEDKIAVKKGKKFALNLEIAEKSDVKGAEIVRSIEIGNIFNFADEYAKYMDGYLSDKSGQRQPILMASYGIGISRLVATLVELNHDEKGIIWPKSVSPFAVHVIGLGLVQAGAKKAFNDLLKKLDKENIEYLADDREAPAGAKFHDADLIGIPYQVIIGGKNTAMNKFELKNRKSGKSKFVSSSELYKLLK